MRLVTIPAHNPGPYTGAGTNTYFLPGRIPVLIDAGSGNPRHLDGVADALTATGTGSLASVLVTHNHPDHASGAPALRTRWPSATFAKWPDPPMVSAIDVEVALSVSTPTANALIRDMKNLGILVEITGQQRGRV